jgi:hypothetical protein
MILHIFVGAFFYHIFNLCQSFLRSGFDTVKRIETFLLTHLIVSPTISIECLQGVWRCLILPAAPTSASPLPAREFPGTPLRGFDKTKHNALYITIYIYVCLHERIYYYEKYIQIHSQQRISVRRCKK